MNYTHNTVTLNNIEIDELIAPLIKLLWDNNIRTYFSCQGGPLDPEEWDYDDLEGNEYYELDGVPYECKQLIIHKDDLDKFKNVTKDIVNNINIIEGSYGFALEWIENPIFEDMFFIYWK